MSLSYKLYTATKLVDLEKSHF